MKNYGRKRSSYLDQFKEKYADEFEKDSLTNRQRLEQKVDVEVKRLYAEFEAHKRLRDLKNTESVVIPHRPISRLVKTKFSNPTRRAVFHYVAPSRVDDSIRNGCSDQMKEKVSS